MAVKPGYKLTEVGVIPEEWNSPRLDLLGAGTTPPIKAGPFGSSLTKDQYVQQGYKVYGQEQVIAGDYQFGDYFISEKKYRELESCAVSPGNILLSLVGTVGKLLIVPDNAPAGIINPRLVRFSFDKRRVLPEFFKFVFESARVQSLLGRHAQGGTMGVLNAGILRSFRIQLPLVPEQRAIAMALSDVDALLGSLDRLIAKKRDHKQAAMQQLLTGKKRLPGFRGGWDVGELREICTKIQDGTHFSPKLGGSDYLYVTSKNIGFGQVDLTNAEMIDAAEHAKIYKRCDVKKDDLLLTKDGANTGNCALNPLDEPFSLLSSVAFLRFDAQRYEPAFFLYQILSNTGQKQIADLMTGNAITRLTLAKINSLRFGVPSFSEQKAIAEVLMDMDAEITTLEQRREKTHSLKQAMMQELLTGRIRLV